MDIHERIHYLRDNQLAMTGKEFAAALGLSQATVSLIENGKAKVQDSTKKLICATWNVNPEWLECGIGPMFNPTPHMGVKKAIEKYSFPEICAKLLYTYDGLPAAQQSAVLAYAKEFISSLIENDSDAANPAPTSTPEEEAARKEINERLKKGPSSPSQPGEGTA